MWNTLLVPDEFAGVRPEIPDAPAPAERDLLRRLAEKARAIAEEPVMRERKDLWRRHNGLRSARPMIMADPECAWEELLPLRDLVCTQPLLRFWELNLRKRIFQFEIIGDDDVAEPWFDIPWDVRIGDFGAAARKTHGVNRGSFTWTPPIRDLDRALETIHFRDLAVDRGRTRRQVELANSIFGELLPARTRGKYWWTLGMTGAVIELIGLEELLLAMCDQPDALHRLMAWMRDEHLRFLEWFEREGLLSDTNENDYVGSGGIGYTDELPAAGRAPGGPARLRDIWGFAESQETVGVSPEMFAEFVFPYQLPLLEKFGLTCYGCCEPVDQRLRILKRIPNLRRVSVSAWADEAKCAAALGRDYIYSRKPNPAMICVQFNEAAIRADIRRTLETAADCNLELIMKDTHTLQGEAWRIRRWVQIAREEIGSGSNPGGLGDGA